MIDKHFVKLLFPFRYTKQVDNRLEDITIINAKGKEKNVFEKFGFDGVELRQGVKELFFCQENVSKIVECYNLVYDTRSYFNLPRRKDEYMQFYTREHKTENPYSVSVGDIRLYLFESEVGFIEMECVYASDLIADYIQCNYFLSEIKSKNNYFKTKVSIWDGKENKGEEVCFTVKELLLNIIKYIPGAKDFYTENDWSGTHEKGIVYSYLYLEEKPDNFYSLVCNLRNNYKESYKLPQRFQTIENDPNVQQQFENSYWITSYNGTINVSYKVNDETTMHFFEKDFYEKMHRLYYVLFLAVLHQRFLLLKAMMEMVEISNQEFDYEETKQQIIKIRNYQSNIHKLKCRAFFEKPSYVQHVNCYYELMENSYCVKELYSDLTSRLSDIEQIYEVYIERIRSREVQLSKIKSNRIEVFVSVFGTFVGLVTVTNEAWGVLEKISASIKSSFSFPLLIAMLVMWLPSSIVVYNNVSNRIKEIKEIKEDIKREKIVTENGNTK